MYNKYNWRFNKEMVNNFDDHVKKSVPLYEEFHKDIINMSVYFSQKNTKIIDIGTSTGVLLNDLYNINKHRNIECIGIDIEKDMIEECNNRYNNLKFEVCDALDFDYTNSSIITSVLTLQFINKKERKEIIKKIHNEMNEDGSLFIVEKVKNNIPDVHDIYNDIYYDFKRDNLTDEDVLDKNVSLRGVMKPLTLQDNIQILKNAGFNKIDVFMKYNNFVGLLAIK